METSCLNNTKVADSFETLIELAYRDDPIKSEDNNIMSQPIMLYPDTISEDQDDACFCIRIIPCKHKMFNK